MLKPPNVVNVYPLNGKRTDVSLPAEWSSSEAVVVFNIDTESASDLMQSSE